MKGLTRLMTAAAAAFAFSAAAFAQMGVYPPAPAAPAPAPSIPPGDYLARRAKAKECSVKADAQGLHGEARKAFREKCKKEGAGSAKPKL
ncbi:MAG: PsiF family protein [Beijerinckiaceae bacterium]|nr:PsiF family protein [Beijerinckiaceae bacterium]